MTNQSFEDMLQEARTEVRELEIKKKNRQLWMIFGIISSINLLTLLGFYGPTKGVFIFIFSVFISFCFSFTSTSLVGLLPFEDWDYSVKTYRAFIILFTVSQVASIGYAIFQII